MQAAIFVMYLVMAGWLMIASVIRVLLQLTGGLPLDPLPFIGAALSLLALAVAVPVLRRRRRTRV